MTKRAVIQVRCSEDEKVAWMGVAADEGVSLSELVRRVLLGQLVSRVNVSPVPGELERVVGVRAPRPSAAQVAKRSFTPDFK